MDNMGLVGSATIVSGSAQLIAANTSVANTAVRIFDVALLTTAAVVNLYAGTSSAAANLLLVVDRNTPTQSYFNGLRFAGGVYQSTNATAANLAVVTYMHEF